MRQKRRALAATPRHAPGGRHDRGTRVGRLAVAVVAAFVGGCGAGEDTATEPSTTSTSSAPASTTAPAATLDCSAAGLSPDPPAQPALPAPVEATRRAIVGAAVACDFERLQQLASRGDAAFTFSFGGGDAAADHWRAAEEAGDKPLWYLARVLGAPHGVVTAAEPDQLVWPSAFAYASWSDVPERDRHALRELYRDEELEDFARFGSYVGHRVGIASDGEWLFFVAGD